MWIDKKPKLLRFNTLRIGKPIYLDEYYDKKLSQEQMTCLENEVIQALLELKNQNIKG